MEPISSTGVKEGETGQLEQGKKPWAAKRLVPQRTPLAKGKQHAEVSNVAKDQNNKDKNNTGKCVEEEGWEVNQKYKNLSYMEAR